MKNFMEEIDKCESLIDGTTIRYSKRFNGHGITYTYVATYIYATHFWYTTAIKGSVLTPEEMRQELIYADSVEVVSTGTKADFSAIREAEEAEIEMEKLRAKKAERIQELRAERAQELGE